MKQVTKLNIDWEDNMDELESFSQNLGDIKFTKRIHPGLVADSRTNRMGIKSAEEVYDWAKREFGHCVMGKWQFLYEKDGKRISCIRGGVSFGKYEIYSSFMEDPERFETAKEVIKRVKKLLF